MEHLAVPSYTIRDSDMVETSFPGELLLVMNIVVQGKSQGYMSRNSRGGQNTLQLIERLLDRGIVGKQLPDVAMGLHNCRMVATSQALTDLGITQISKLASEMDNNSTCMD